MCGFGWIEAGNKVVKSLQGLVIMQYTDLMMQLVKWVT